MSSSPSQPPPQLPPETSDTSSGTSTTGGFVARIGGVSLLDLVQFECQRGGQRILRVASRGQSGYLYFRGGSLVHAATAVFTGTAAVREMLAWHSGSIESGMGGWPTHESIPADWQTLLFGEEKVVVAGAPRSPERAPAQTPSSDRTTVVLAPTGQLLAGEEHHGLPEAAAYAAHMAELIGSFLGFERFCALEATYGHEQLLVGRGKSGNLLARRERSASDLEDLRRELVSDADPQPGVTVTQKEGQS